MHSIKIKMFVGGMLHGKIDQKSRETVLKKFKTKHFNVLVATDIAGQKI